MMMSLDFEPEDFINLSHFAVSLVCIPKPFWTDTPDFIRFFSSFPHNLWQKKDMWELPVWNSDNSELRSLLSVRW